MTTYRQLADYLVNLGIDEVPHTTKNYLAHLIALYNMMKSEGCSEELCRAGMFHSIYGTERFQRFALPLEKRREVRELIGLRAEHLAYWNCAMDRVSFDRAVSQALPPHRVRDRITGEDVELSSDDFDHLCMIHLYDWLEQVPRSKDWDYRREAYRQMAERLGGPVLNKYAEVFADEGKE
jgi:hypothetical protein